MKTLLGIVLGVLVAGSALAIEQPSEADQKWGAAVEKMIAAGPTTVSTPTETRVQIAKQLAEKAGRKIEVTKVDNGYRIKVQ
jgi:hypothetical protein